MSNFISDYWKTVENKSSKPEFYRNSINIRAIDFLNKKNNPEELKELITNLYNGDFLIIKNAISNKFLENLKSELIKISDNEKSSFYKILDGCPNFHRVQDEKVIGKYSVNAIRHSYYFFRWNQDKLKIFDAIDRYWSLIKYLGGLQEDQYVNNIPKDGVVDRVQVVRYPHHSGYIAKHQHDPKNQRLIISVYMSQKNIDYSSGGTYVYNSKNEKINLEDSIEIGDIGVFYATLIHGVDKVTLDQKDTETKKTSGRWWLGPYSPESDYSKHRTTSKAL